MTKSDNTCCTEPQKLKEYQWHKHSGNGFYFLGFLGAAIYFIGHATTFWLVVLGLLKACVWPAFLVYEMFKLLLG